MPQAKVSTERLLASAAAMAEASRRHEAVLIDGGLPTNLIAQLDSQLLPLIGADQALLAAWQTAKRIQRKPGIKIGSTTATTPLPVSTPPVVTSPVTTPLVTPPSANEVSAA